MFSFLTLILLSLEHYGMKYRHFMLVACFCCFLFSASAGDVAHLVHLGFSPDGKTYAFGEYGMLDKTYRSYAQIYIVDVEKNEFVKNGVFKTSPSALTSKKESHSVFLSLQNQAGSMLTKTGVSIQNDGRVIYAQTEKTKHNTNFYVRDFETSYEYSITVHKEIKGLNAAFYISFDTISPAGVKKSYTVGNKTYFRTGVKDYNLKKVIINAHNDALVFVLEKVISDTSGDCIRYMVETIKL